MKSIRTQIDGLDDEYAEAGALDTGTDTPTRQEFKDEADLNILLARFGVTGANPRPMVWGQEIDYNMGLQDALIMQEQAGRVETGVPPELRAKYPTWRHVMSAVESGQYQQDLYNLAATRAAAEEKEKTDKAASAPVS